MWAELFERGPKLPEPPEKKPRPAYAKKKTCARCHQPWLLKHYIEAPFDVCQKCKAKEKLGHAT